MSDPADLARELTIDFVGGAVGHRHRFGGGRGQDLPRAAGFVKGVTPSVVDATAGLGRDAFLLASLGAQVTLIEPCIYWPDSHNAFHIRTVDADHRAKIGCPGEHLDARAAADRLKRKIADTMRGLGAVNFQIGKFYSYREGRDPVALALLDAIKAQLDPKGLMDPGVLER